MTPGKVSPLTSYIALLTVLGIPDPEQIRRVAQQSVRFLQTSPQDRDQARTAPGQLLRLERRWYDSLENGGLPDYGVYHEPLYLAEAWACWAVYSRRYLTGLAAAGSLNGQCSIRDSLNPVRRIVDLGCGIGLSTMALSVLFPEATVYGTNLDGTPQSKVARAVLQGEPRCQLLKRTQDVPPGPVDVVFASEYFEHFPRPVQHLTDDVLTVLQPRALLIANTFAQPAIGHFPTYDIDGHICPGHSMPRLFNAALHRAGYNPVPTRLWNRRPQLWIQGAGTAPQGRLL